MASLEGARLNTDYGLRPINPERLAAILRHAGSEILDVGCGNGSYVLRLNQEFKIRGVDHRSFDAWDQRPELFGISDAQTLDFPDCSVDTVLSFETLEHLPHPDIALREYFRVCRKNVILTVPNCDLSPGMKGSGIIFNHWIDRTHVNFWDLSGICNLVTEAGFTVVEKSGINKLNLGYVVAEALGLEGRIRKTVSSLFRRLQRREYSMTSLVIAAKPQS
jgi:SAM-dependent methyltransferase